MPLGPVSLGGHDVVTFLAGTCDSVRWSTTFSPLLKRSHSSDFPCSDTFSDFTFWREPPPPFEDQDVRSASA